MRFKSKLLIAIATTALASMPMQAQFAGHSPAAQVANDPARNGLANVNDQHAMDQQFLQSAAGANMAEVSEAKLAMDKSSNQDVKAFAQKMIDDHTAMQKDVEAAASQMNVTLPTAPPKSDQNQAKKLAGMDGPAFDKAYVADQVKDHKNVLSEMKHESSTTQNAQLRDLSSKGATEVQQHLQLAQDLQAKVGK